ncbi:MAG: alpha/beta fold hydrolase, partial [Thalassobaculaceae bacterium]
MPVAQINGHAMYYEIHGQGDPLICSGGWGTFCHGGERHVPEGLIDNHQVILFDHRAIGESSDDPAVPARTGLYAEDVIGLIEHLGLPPVHLVGIVGIGAC